MQSPLQAETLPVSRLVPKGTQGESLLNNGQGHAGLVSQRPACKGLVPGGSGRCWEWLRGGAWGGSPLSGLQNSPLPPYFLIDM